MMKEVIAGYLAIFSLLIASFSSSFLKEDYNHFSQSFSELGELNSPNYLFFNFFAFILPGFLMYFSLNNIDSKLEIETRDVLSLRIGSFGWIITGIFPLSYSVTWIYWLHIIGAVISFIFGPLGVIVISTKLSNNVGWVYFSLFSTIIAFIAWASILLFDLYFHKAIAQLITIVLLFLWYFIFLIKINRMLIYKIDGNNVFQG